MIVLGEQSWRPVPGLPTVVDSRSVYVLAASPASQPVVLDGVAREIYSALVGSSVHEIVASLLGVDGAPRDEVALEVETFLADLEARGVVTRVAPSAGVAEAVRGSP